MVLIWTDDKGVEQWGEIGFRPLAGIMVLIAFTHLKIHDKSSCCFRPLAGIMVLIQFYTLSTEQKLVDVSVPLRGLWFLSGIVIMALVAITVLFPSPCGDYGSYLPSSSPQTCRSGNVSVPLRGLWFLSRSYF